MLMSSALLNQTAPPPVDVIRRAMSENATPMDNRTDNMDPSRAWSTLGGGSLYTGREWRRPSVDSTSGPPDLTLPDISGVLLADAGFPAPQAATSGSGYLRDSHNNWGTSTDARHVSDG